MATLQDWELRLEQLREKKKKKPGVEFADDLQREYETLEHRAQTAAQDEAAANGWRAEPAPKLTARDALVGRIERKIGQALPSPFHSGPLPVKANFLCSTCGYDRNKSLHVMIERDLSAQWTCYNSSCDLDGHVGKRGRGKPTHGAEAIWDWDDDDQKRFAQHYLFADLPDVLRRRLLFEEDAEFDAGPGEPKAFLEGFIFFMKHDAAARKYWNRAIDRYTRDVFGHAKAATRAKVKVSGRRWPPRYLADDTSIMGRESTRKLITEIYPHVRDQRWATRDCVEWHGRNPDWKPPEEYEGIIGPVLVTLDSAKTAKALGMSPDRLWAYMRAMESTGLIQRIAHLKHGRRLWSLGHWQKSAGMHQPRPLWFLKNDPNLLARLRTVQP